MMRSQLQLIARLSRSISTTVSISIPCGTRLGLQQQPKSIVPSSSYYGCSVRPSLRWHSPSRQPHHLQQTRAYSDSSLDFGGKFKEVLSVKYATQSRKTVTVPLDGDFLALDCVYLRDACQCPLCVDSSTQQKLYQTTDIPRSIRPKWYKQHADSSFEVEWTLEDGNYSHRSIYTLEELRLFSNLRNRVRARYNDQNYILWDRTIMERDVQFIDYEQYISNDEALYFTLLQLARYGLVFIKNVPNRPNNDAVESIAERVGNIKHTFYGKTWDVKSVANSKNIAYTSLNLGLHMDLLYYESPPGLQFLHCIQNSVKGGSSYFADSFRAAEWVRMNSPNSFQSLTTYPLTFHYKNDNQHYHYIRPTVVLDDHSYRQRKRIAHVNYSPPFQAPFEVDTGFPPPNAAFRQFVAALKTFATLVEDPVNQFEIRLNPGECVVFQNRRALHARREFDATSGDRWLKGTYVDTDSYMSKLRVLSAKYVKEKVVEEEDYAYIR